METNHRSPLSGSERVDLLRAIPAERLIAGWRDTFDLDIRDEIPPEGVELHRCRDTGLEFFRPVSAEGSAELYAALQRFDWYYDPRLKGSGGGGRERWEHRRAVDDLGDSDEVLEVGCGRGDFLVYAAAVGLQARGVEINRAAVAEARERGLEVDATDLFELARDEPESRGAVCSFQTLEHIAEPLPFLVAMIRLLRPGGHLIVAVPNGGSYLRHLPNNWLDLPPHHMLRWGERPLRALVDFLPLVVDRIAHEPLAPYNVNGWVSAARNRIASRFGIGPARILLNRYAATVVRSLLLAGPRRWIRGHSIYAAYRRTAGSLPAAE